MEEQDLNFYNAETGCCPRFNPEPFDEKEHTWQDKLFVKDKIRCLCHIPLNFGPVIVRNTKKIAKAQALIQEPPILLCDEESSWSTKLYIEATKDVPDAKMAKISGTFLTKVFEGPYKEVKNWYKQMGEFVRSKGKEPKNIYAYYTTCPKCAKHYGKNYTVMVAEV